LKDRLNGASVLQGAINSCGDATGLFVIRITNVNMNYCGVNATVRATHTGSNTGLWNFSYPAITSKSTACFDGGDVGSFTTGYDPRLSVPYF